MTTANYIVLGSKKSPKNNPPRIVISINVPTDKGVDNIMVTLGYTKEIGWSLLDNMNTSKACNAFSFYILHDKPIHLKAFQNLADTYYKYAQHLDEYMGIQRIHKWEIN